MTQILKDEFKSHFRNVSRIMDCVGCDKCRLWGKTQITGVATGLKILFSSDEDPEMSDGGVVRPPFELKRSEIVAFMWTIHRFSESLAAVEQFREMWAHRNSVAKEQAEADQKPIEKVEDTVTSPSSEQLMSDAIEPGAESPFDTQDAGRGDRVEGEARQASPSSSIRLAEPAIFSPAAASVTAHSARTVQKSSYKASRPDSAETSLGPRISGILARLYDVCRHSIAACLMLVERGVSYVVGSIGHTKDEL